MASQSTNQGYISKQILERLVRDGEYYGRYDETGRNSGPLAKFLLECGIDARYAMSGTPQQNGVAERRNRTLLDMVRCMLSNSSLPEFLWGEALRTAAYILNQVPSSLMYAQVCTRPDIAFVVGMLGRYLSNPGSQHWKAAKKVLRYLQGTKDLMLTYQRTSLLDVVGFCDADFAGCIDDKKSTTGYIFMMAGGAVSWKSVKQTLTASSTMEAEYVACYEACCHAMWMRNFVSALGVVDSISRPLKLFCDNSAAVAFSKNTRSISRSKHIDVKFYFVKEKVAESLIDIEHMSTKSMLADPLTKGLPIIAFQEHVSQMGLLEA
uniref:Integrase catalytic domain-containing protein n=1 Tax=Vitis vinifera TaxID=29760 RepID=A5BTI8_VITVI|nr:hypothetical protein VITISV_041358 [Vitis vinifera]